MTVDLKHVGILGMRWGRRMARDGSVSTLVRGKRVPLMTTVRGKPVQVNGKALSNATRAGAKSFFDRIKNKSNKEDKSSDDHKSSSVLKKKKLKDMSNDELKKLTARLSLEKQFKDLSKKDPSSAKKFVTEVLQGSAKQLASKYLAKSIEDGLPLLIATLSTKLKG